MNFKKKRKFQKMLIFKINKSKNSLKFKKMKNLKKLNNCKYIMDKYKYQNYNNNINIFLIIKIK